MLQPAMVELQDLNYIQKKQTKKGSCDMYGIYRIKSKD